jgi:uncharacterized membrane protein YsdA (DUF1294 family)/cold shock CspA family protein
MRYQGKLVEWSDEKAFGYVLPNAGGRKIFVHWNEFQNRLRSSRPSVGDLLSFEVGLDAQKRSCAINVSPVLAPLKRKQIEARNESREVAATWSRALALVWAVAILSLFALSKFPWKFAAAWFLVNVATYVLYVVDKSAAERGRWRVSEKTLHLLALAGGWPAAAIAQQRLRHKTNKAEFRFVFWLTVIVNMVAMLWFATQGAAYLSKIAA